MKNKVVFIIPYFGKKPDYFDLWLQSAERNSQYNFFIFTDVEIETNSDSNVKVYKMSFEELVKLTAQKLDMKIKLEKPYKLCDYKPVYGLIFEEYIQQYDFWGFCDVDLILGNLSKFISDRELSQFDKIYFHGHFCLMRNSEKYKMLFMQQYQNVLDYKYTFTTNYICHFDENGTIAWAHQFDKSIRFYDNWDFYDADSNNYKFIYDEEECFFEWNDGKLFLVDSYQRKKEIMYLHLQKRTMYKLFEGLEDKYIIARDEFRISNSVVFPIKDYRIDVQKETEFYNRRRQKRKKEIIQNIINGSIKYRIHRTRKKLLEQ